MSETIELDDDVEVDADNLEAALDELPDGCVEDERAAVGDVLVAGDGAMDEDVTVTKIDHYGRADGNTGLYRVSTLRDKIENARADDGPYLFGSTSSCGFKIPLADVSSDTFEIVDTEESGTEGYYVAFDTSVNVSSLNRMGSTKARSDHSNLDGHVYVPDIEIQDD